MSRFRDYLDYYRRKLERCMTDETTVLHIIEKLNKTDFPVNDLLNSGIYKLIRSIGKSGKFYNVVFPLYNKWKALILAAENDQKIVQNNIPAQNRVSEPLENDVSDSFKGLPIEVQNGFTESLQKNAMHSASNITSFRPLRNQLPVNDRMKSSTAVQPPASDAVFKVKNSTPPASDAGFKFRNSTPPASDAGFKFRNSTPPANDMGFKIRNSTPHANDRGYKIKNSSPVQQPANNGGYKFKSSTPFEPSTNDGGFKAKSSTLAQPPVNKFQPFSNLNASFPVHNVNTNENSAEQNTMAELSVNFDSQSNCSNALSSPHSSNSQNPLDIGSTNTASPNKIGRIPDPYTIEMKEGMFRAVKCEDELSPEIMRVKRLYNREEDNCDSEPEGMIEENVRTKRREHSPKNIKNSKSAGNRNVEKGHSSKSKNHTAEKSNKNKVNTERHSGKSEKVKTSSPLNKSAIDKSKLEKKEKSSEALKNLSPHKVSSKSISKGSSSAVKSISKGSPSFKSITKESPMKTITKGSPQVKSSIKGSPQVKSSTKGSPSVFINHANSASCDISRVNTTYKDCDKRTNKVLSNEATDSFMCSKKERTSLYSGKKSFQEVPSLRTSCVRVLRKNIDNIKNTRKVPYEVLKPVLQNCSATQLYRIEEHNHYLLTNTEEIWKSLCQRKYRDMKPTSTGTWRNLFWKTREDQDKKLKNITASISASMQKAAPERQVKLTLIESPERPRSKKIKLSVPEPKPVLSMESSSHQINSCRESNAPSNKFAPKESSSNPKLLSKESHLLTHKKAKKAPVAPLMSKVKKTILAMHKK